MQYNWLKDLEPEACMFKFRLPFYTDDIDNLNEYVNSIGKSDFEYSPELNVMDSYNNKKMLYPKGKIFIQPWQGKSSTESRLVIKKSDIYNLVSYDAYEYDARFNYYNLIERVVRKHDNGIEFYKYGYCECNDCAIELTILKEYIFGKSYKDESHKNESNKKHIMEEFNFDKNSNIKLIGYLCARLMCLLGTRLEGTNEHGINRYPSNNPVSGQKL